MAQSAGHLLAQGAVPTTYRAITTRTSYPEPALPGMEAAGHRFTDPTFGTRIVRVSDANTMPNGVGRAYSTASAAHQLAWNAASDRFYIRSTDGWYIPYTFNAATMTTARLQPSSSGNGGLIVSSQAEPQFSFRSAPVLFGSRQHAVNDWPVIRAFNFDTLAYTDILDLGTITSLLPATYAAALSSSATSPERISVIFGGAAQDLHYKAAVFQVSPAGANPFVLNTQAATLTVNGVTTATGLPPFNLHHAWIDQSGRYVLLFPAIGWAAATYYVWNLDTHAITPVTARPEGHEATGFGVHVNQSCCTVSTYDAAQWQYRSLATPNTTTDLIAPVLAPQEVYLADHTSWNNAQPDALAPILSSLYRYFDGTLNTTPWRAWDNEVVAIDTHAPGSGGTVWRFAHHRSNVAPDAGGSAAYFWYQPRAVISPNGRWALFTSNWEKTLGAATFSSEPEGTFRTDVFLLSLVRRVGLLPFTDDPLIVGATQIRALHITELRQRIDALRAQFGLASFAWTDPTLGAGVTARAVHLTEPRTAIQQAYSAAGRPAPAFTDPAIVAGVSPIRAVHIQELRDLIVDLEPN